MIKDNWLNANIKPLLGLVIVVGVITYLFMVTIISKDTTVRSQALIAIVAMGTSVAGYYFGYSQGASKKDDVIASQSSSALASTETGDINVKK